MKGREGRQLFQNVFKMGAKFNAIIDRFVYDYLMYFWVDFGLMLDAFRDE